MKKQDKILVLIFLSVLAAWVVGCFAALFFGVAALVKFLFGG